MGFISALFDSDHQMNCRNRPTVIKFRLQIWYGFLCFTDGRVPDDFSIRKRKVEKMVLRYREKILRVVESEWGVSYIFAR